MADVVVKSQGEVAYGLVQEVARLLPDAVAETYPDAKPDLMRAIGAITTAVTGALAHSFFCVALVDGDVAGFLAGVSESDVFSDRKYGRDVFAWVRPSARASTAYRDMRAAFEKWARENGAREVRGTLIADAPDALVAEVEREGYRRVGVIVVKKVT